MEDSNQNELATRFNLNFDLSRQGARIFIHLHTKTSVQEGVQEIAKYINQVEPDTDITVITNTIWRAEDTEIRNTTSLQICQINQSFLDVLFSRSISRIFIIETSANLGQFVVPREIGRIIALNTDFKSLQDITETTRFLSGPSASNLNISPLDIILFLGQIGYQECLDPKFGSFRYEGLPITINMTGTQYGEFLQRMAHEEVLKRKEPFSALQATNFLYPPQLQIEHNLSRIERPEISPDIFISQGGWVTQDIINEISRWSPKIAWLISFLRLNPGRHVIYTAFNESNGVKIISTILTGSGFNVITITGDDRQQDRYRKINEFNSNQFFILVSNLYAFSPLHNIKSLIMFEQHPYDSVLNSYLQQIAISPYNFFTSVLFLISRGPYNESTIEVNNYLIMADAVNTRDAILEILKRGPLEHKIEQYREIFRIPDLTPYLFKDTYFKSLC